MRAPSTQLLFEASDVADFCGTDVATIYTWVKKGNIPFLKSPGGRLRFRREAVIDFLRRYRFPIPGELIAGRPHVIAMDPDASWLVRLKQTLGGAFDVDTFTDAYDALLAIGDRTPDAIVMETTMPALDGAHCIRRIREHERLRHARVVIFAEREIHRQPCLDAGASGFVLKPAIDELHTTLRRTLGPR